MTQETEDETIERRSRNANAAMGCLFEGGMTAFDWVWILLGLALLAFWLLS